MNDPLLRKFHDALVDLTTSQVIQSGQQLDAFGKITEVASQTLGIERVSIWLFDSSHTRLTCSDLFEQTTHTHSSGVEVTASDYPRYFQALQQIQPIDATDVKSDPRINEFWETYCQPLGITSLLDVPIRMKGEIVGVVCHEHIGPQRQWTLEEIHFARSITNFVSLALESLERERIELALRESEERTRLIVENALDAVITMDTHGLITGWNPQAEIIFGWSSEEAVGQPLVTLIVPQKFREAHNSGLEHFRKTGEGAVLNKRLEISALHRDGHEFPVELAISPIQSQKGVTFSAFLRNITDRKQSEEAVKSIAKFPDENPSPVLRVSQDGFLLYANPASTRLLHTWGIRVGEPVPMDMKRFVQTTLGMKTSQEIEVTCDDFIYSLVVAPISEEAYVNMYGRNVTARRKAEREMLEAKETAELANRAKSDFLATMSHELRTPLTGILGYAQLLKNESGISDKHRNGLAVIENSADHLLSLINEILDLSRIEAGSLELHLEPINLCRHLETLSNIMRARAEDKRLSYTFECLSELPPRVMGDERRLRQVLINLLDNAIKYTREGGLALKVGYHEDTIRFLVEDTGMGIKPEHLEAIFESFQRVHDRKLGVEGTGLGLAISQKLVALMGGTLQVKSTVGEGSQFWFDLHLPSVEGQSDEAVVKEPQVIAIKGERKKLLIVDDKLDNRLFLRDLLNPLGFETQEAQDGEECLGQALAFHPDIILMDLRMPTMDGLEATRKIRTIPELKDVIIIAISASSFEHNRHECLEAGTDAFLSKPFRIIKLLELLRDHLQLELVYEKTPTSTQEPRSNRQSPKISVPSLEVLTPLLEHAKRGDIKKVITQIETISESPEFHTFAAKVLPMAKNFQVTKLCAYLQTLLPSHETKLDS